MPPPGIAPWNEIKSANPFPRKELQLLIERWPESKISKQRSNPTVHPQVPVDWTSRLPAWLCPVVTVQKIPIDPAAAPVVTHGLPVTGLKEVRLLHNLIVPTDEGKSRLVPRGEVVPLETVPERWRTSQFIEAVDQYRKNKIMMLHDFSCAVPNFDGQSTVWREKLFSAYALYDPASIPNRVMESLVEGQDYLSEWDEDRRKKQEHKLGLDLQAWINRTAERCRGILDGRS